LGWRAAPSPLASEASGGGTNRPNRAISRGITNHFGMHGNGGRTMKILYDYGAFVMQARGGVSRIMCEVIRRELAREDVNGRVFAGFHRNFELHQLGREFPGKVRGCLLPQTLVRQRLFLPVNRALFIPYAKHFAPDLCHLTFYQTPPVPTRTRVVVTVHDLICEVLGPKEKNPEVVLRERALRRADGIICVSEHTKTDLLRLYPVGDKPVLVAPHGNSLRQTTPVAPDVSGPFFLYVGTRAVAYKNYALLLKTFARNERLKPFALVCFGGGAFTPTELAAIRQAGLAGRVLHRQGTDAALAGCYQQATALIYPSQYEGFGLPPIEAMGFGCPVLASSAPPMPEINGDAALYFDPGSVEQLLAAITRLLNENGLRTALIERGKQREQLFSWDNTARQIHDFYRSLLPN
jgi:glycosyltransferase involved in cell wall biosynthesis